MEGPFVDHSHKAIVPLVDWAWASALAAEAWELQRSWQDFELVDLVNAGIPWDGSVVGIEPYSDHHVDGWELVDIVGSARKAVPAVGIADHSLSRGHPVAGNLHVRHLDPCRRCSFLHVQTAMIHDGDEPAVVQE